MPRMSRLALDGPCNGRYIGPDTARKHGYTEDVWPTGEAVYVHGRTLDAAAQEAVASLAEDPEVGSEA